MRDVKFHPDHYYHIYNRGVDKRTIFEDDYDKIRFLSSIQKLNEGSLKILCFCLMDNHFHLLIQPEHVDSIPTYMARLGNSYTKYFNAKYGRSGRLFQGPYQAVQINTDAHLLHITRYIHLNPTGGKFTEYDSGTYRWTSLQDYLFDQDNEFVSEYPVLNSFSSREDYSTFLSEWNSYQPLGLGCL